MQCNYKPKRRRRNSFRNREIIMSAKFSKLTGGIYPLAAFKTFPEDAIDIPEALYDKYKNGEVSCLTVTAGVVSEFVEEPLNGNALTRSQISEIESSVTSRRMREAVLGIDAGWLKDVDAKITDLRKKLK